MAKKVPSKKTTKSKKNTVSKNDKVKFDEQLKHLDDSLKNEKDKYLRLFAEFENFKKSTSIIPFLAILEGRQELKIKEFFRLSQFGILIAIGVLWWSHQYINIAVKTFNSSFLSEFFN